MVRKGALITSVYLLVGAVCLWRHELWSDEAQHLLIAANSKNLNELCNNARWEGHPPLWPLLLFVLTRFTVEPVAMQVLNLVLAAMAVFLFCAFAPFSWRAKTSLVFGYFLFFEFGIISRNYALATMVLFSICSMSSMKRSGPGGYLLLLILSLSHLFGMFIAAAIAISDQFVSKSRKTVTLTAALILAQACILWVFVLPPQGHMLVEQYNTDARLSTDRLRKVAELPVRAFLHIPDFFHENLWNRDYLLSSFPILGAVAAMCLLVLPVFILRQKGALLLFYVTFLLLAAFVFFSPLRLAQRHAGFLFLAFVVACWLYPGEKARRTIGTLSVLQLLSGLVMTTADLRRPFSQAKKTADFVQATTQAGTVIALSNQGSGPALSAYLGRDLYYPEKHVGGSFADWSTDPFMIPEDSVFAGSSRLGERVLLILNFKTGHVHKGFKLIEIFEGGIVRSENFYLYEYRDPE